MIGNKYLAELYSYPDEAMSFNQLLDYLKSKDSSFIESLASQPVDPINLDSKEREYLTKAVALIDYYLQIHHLDVPKWIRHKDLHFEKPHYVSSRISDFEKIKLQYTNPAPFRARNVYFHMEGIERV